MRQTAATRGASARSSRNHRLDPTALPLHYIATFAEGGRSRQATIYLDRRQAIIKRRSSIGAPLTVCLPVSGFDGVAVRLSPIGDAGDIEVVVELRHRDPALSLPLLVADDPGEVADDWQAWGQILNLPLLIVDRDNRVIAAESRAGALGRVPPHQRRRHSFFADRRPRFLARRKRGRLGRLDRLSAREIIARD
jgi:hypothetical protein